MSEENVLQLELEKLDIPALKRVAQVWNIPKIGKDKKSIIKNLATAMNDPFYVRGILEKLSATQVVIYTSILKSKKNILTLGEISRKINLPPVNAEMYSSPDCGRNFRPIHVFRFKTNEGVGIS